MDGRIVRQQCHELVSVSCHFEHCKVLLVASLTHVRSAVASTRPLNFLTFRSVGPSVTWLVSHLVVNWLVSQLVVSQLVHLSTHPLVSQAYNHSVSRSVGKPTSQVGQPTSQLGQPISQVGQPISQLGQTTSQLGQPTSQVGQPTSQLVARSVIHSVSLSVKPQ